MAKYTEERVGQREFYERFLPRVDKALSIANVLGNNNDGVVNGNLLEFKLNVGNLNAVLFQCIKYLSAMRIKGEPVPANILIVDLNKEKAYLYKSADYLQDIEKVYIGGASKHNEAFVAGEFRWAFDYSDALGAENLVAALKTCNWTKINIDENCIVGWAERYYSIREWEHKASQKQEKNESAKKEQTRLDSYKRDFLAYRSEGGGQDGELRKPNRLKAYIHPYRETTNFAFKYLMDKLNDNLQKKNLGAFYTPYAYAEKSHELVRAAIARVPAGNDYIILDRCQGTGNLEAGLTDEELSHCILSTREFFEYKVMVERFAGRPVRDLIPPSPGRLVEEGNGHKAAGDVDGGDALSEEYIKNERIMKYVRDPKCTVILFENPPYAEPQARTHSGKASWKNSYVVQEMRNEVTDVKSNELGNVFIWSAFKYYLRQPTDSYVVYSPPKYWKAQHLINKEFIKGFAFNRKGFHASSAACIMVVLWQNVPSKCTAIDLECYDISEAGALLSSGAVTILRTNTMYSDRYYDKKATLPETAITSDASLCTLSGLEHTEHEGRREQAVFHTAIIGYMVACGATFDNAMLRTGLYTAGYAGGNGFYLHKNRYLQKLPMFAAGMYLKHNNSWIVNGQIGRCADGADRYFEALAAGKLNNWLLKCLLFTCLEMQNHMCTFTGADGRLYRNELCLDTTNGATVASMDIERMQMNAAERKLLQQWNILLEAAKRTREYNPDLTYGVYQIYAEIDTSYKDDKGMTVYNNPEVHSALQTLKQLIRPYYNKEIVPNLFKYEFLK